MTHRSERLLNMLYASPRSPEIDARKARFDDINAFISQHGGWMTSVPGAREMTFDALPGSPVPRMLEDRGYLVMKTGTSERILPHAIRQTFTIRADGELEPFTEGSSKPVTKVTRHAGVTTVEQFDLQRSY